MVQSTTLEKKLGFLGVLRNRRMKWLPLMQREF